MRASTRVVEALRSRPLLRIPQGAGDTETATLRYLLYGLPPPGSYPRWPTRGSTGAPTSSTPRAHGSRCSTR
jgi:hypothetical protein